MKKTGLTSLKRRFCHQDEIKNVLKDGVFLDENGQAWPFFVTFLIKINLIEKLD